MRLFHDQDVEMEKEKEQHINNLLSNQRSNYHKVYKKYYMVSAAINFILLITSLGLVLFISYISNVLFIFFVSSPFIILSFLIGTSLKCINESHCIKRGILISTSLIDILVILSSYYLFLFVEKNYNNILLNTKNSFYYIYISVELIHNLIIFIVLFLAFVAYLYIGIYNRIICKNNKSHKIWVVTSIIFIVCAFSIVAYLYSLPFYGCIV